MNRKEIVKIAKDYLSLACSRGFITNVTSKDVVIAIEKYRRENNYPNMIFSLDDKGILSVNGKSIIALTRVWQPYYYNFSKSGNFYEDKILARNEMEA